MNKRSDSSSPFEDAKSLSRINCGRRGPMGNLAHARIMDSIRLFGERVIPHFRIMKRCGGERLRPGGSCERTLILDSQ